MTVYRPVKSRFFHYDFQFRGTRHHGSTGCETRRKAEQVERNIREKVALGLPLDGSDQLTLDQAAGRWWLEHGSRLQSATEISRRLKDLLKLMGKDTPIGEITTDLVARAIQKRRGQTFTRSKERGARKFVASNRTINLAVVATLRPILKRARRTWGVKGLPEVDWGELWLAEKKPHPRDFSPAEIDGLLDALPYHWRDFAAFQALYGLRLSEMFFPLSAVDLDGARIFLADRKANDDHTVPLMPEALAILQARIGRAQAAKIETPWFRELRGGRLKALTYWSAQSALRRAMTKCGLRASKGAKGSHDLRHHSAMQMLRQTGNMRATQKLLGHASVQSTMVYAHAMEDDVRAGLAAVSRNSPGPAPEAEAEGLPDKGKASA